MSHGIHNLKTYSYPMCILFSSKENVCETSFSLHLPFLLVVETLLFSSHQPKIHARKLIWNLKIIPLTRNIIWTKPSFLGFPCSFSRVYLLIFRGVTTNKIAGPLLGPFPLAGFSSPQEIGDLSALRCCKVGPGIPVKKWSDGIPLVTVITP